MAASLYNKFAETGHADSAGTYAETAGDTIAKRAEVSEGAKHVITVMDEVGVDVSKKVQTQLTKDMLDDYDKVVVMAKHEAIPEWLSSNSKYERWQIEDPRSKGLEDTRATREEIKQQVLNLIKQS